MRISITVIGMLLSLTVTNIAYSQSPIALIVDGYKKDCTVTRADGGIKKCHYDMDLFAGDEIIKLPDASALVIDFLSPEYTKAVKVTDTKLRIVTNAPGDKTTLLSKIESMFPFLRKTAKQHAHLATRALDAGTSSKLLILPGGSVTLLPNQSTVFSWDGTGDTFLVKNASGRNIFRAPLDGKHSFTVSPEQIGMKPGELYSWTVEGSSLNKWFQIRLLSNDMSSFIHKSFEDINTRQWDAAIDSKVAKAALLQEVSDLYPSDADLYWLSLQLTDGLSDDVAKGIRVRAMKHLTMSEKS